MLWVRILSLSVILRYRSAARLMLLTLLALQLEGVQVIQTKYGVRGEGTANVQLGGGDAKPSRVNKPLRGHFEKAGVSPKRELVEFPVSSDAVLAPGAYSHGK